MAHKYPLKDPQGLYWKDRIRVRVLPSLARIQHAVGRDWADLERKYHQDATLAQAASIRQNYTGPKTEHPLDIVFLTMNGTFAVREAVFGLALKERGHRVRYVLCDQVLPLCEVKRVDREDQWETSCARCYMRGRQFLETFGFEIIPASALMGEPKDYNPRWDEIVESALLKHYRVGTLDDVEGHEERRKLLRKSATVSDGIGKSLVEMKPDRVIMSHGIYTTWGPQFELLDEAGIPILIIATGKKKGSKIFNWNRAGWYLEDRWQKVKDTELTPEQNRQLDDYLQSRLSHSKDVRVYNFGELESKEQLISRLELAPEKPIFSLFTNVLWDASSAKKELVFNNPIEWVVETVRWFAMHPEKQLIVKIHPSEVVIGTRQSFMDVLMQHIDEIPENVRVIEPHEKINSWSVLSITDVGLVHTSTVGLELALEGKPSVLVSRTHYRGKGFTIDASGQEQYYDILENYESYKQDQEIVRQLARRYAYLAFEKYQVPIPFYDVTVPGYYITYKFTSTQELLDNQVMQEIVGGIEMRENISA